MTVLELIEYLEQFDSNQEVMIAQPSGDYWGTVCASKITEAEEQYVEYSDYHKKYKINNPGDEDEEIPTSKAVIILQ
jgi:hypothetical protein